MSKSLRSLAVKLPLLAGSLVVTAVAAQSPLVVFRGLDHARVGNASLTLDSREDALLVRTRDPRGVDGVRVALGREATSWTARMRPSLATGLPFNLTLGAIADGQPISHAFLRQNGDLLEVSAHFTGATPSTYSAQVYNNGRLVGAQGGLSARARVGFAVDICTAVPDFCEWVPGFFTTAMSECVWRIGSATGVDTEMVMPDGAVLTGDELRLVEEVDPAGHYPYLTFSAITIQTNAPTLTLFSETVR